MMVGVGGRHLPCPARSGESAANRSVYSRRQAEKEKDGGVPMVEEGQNVDFIAAMRGLDAGAPEDRDRATEELVRFVLADTRAVMRHWGLGKMPDAEGFAEEVADDIVFKLCRNRDIRNRLLTAGHAQGYLRLLIRNAILDRPRGRTRLPDSTWLEVSDKFEVEDPARPLDTIEAADTVQSLWKSINDDDRELLRLAFWEGLSVTELVQRLGVSYAAGAQRLYRTLRKVRRILQKAGVAASGTETEHPSAASVPTWERRPEWGTRAKPRKSATAGEGPGAERSQPPVTAEKFRRLAAAWREGRGPTSSLSEMAMRPEYQQIIGMGRDAVPLILEELQKEPDHWFWALAATTGEDPVPPEHKGKLSEMTKAWLEWGERHGYVQSDDA